MAHEPKHGYCSCGNPQSFPIPHEHDLTDREKQIIAFYESKQKAWDAMYHALKVASRQKLNHPHQIMEQALAKATAVKLKGGA